MANAWDSGDATTRTINSVLLVVALILLAIASPYPGRAKTLADAEHIQNTPYRYAALPFSPVQDGTQHFVDLRIAQDALGLDNSYENRLALQNAYRAIMNAPSEPAMTEEDIGWLLALGDFEYYEEWKKGDAVSHLSIALIARAGQTAQKLRHRDAAVDILNIALNVADNSSLRSEHTTMTIKDILASLMESTIEYDTIIRLASELMDLEMPKYTNRWAGMLLNAKYRKALERLETDPTMMGERATAYWHDLTVDLVADVERCLRLVEYEVTNDYSCRHYVASLDMWQSNVEEATRGFAELHKRNAQISYNPMTKKKVVASHFPVALEHSDCLSLLPYNGIELLDVDFTVGSSYLAERFVQPGAKICSDQEWPFYLENGEVKTLDKDEVDRMYCMEDAKEMKLFKVTDGSVYGQSVVVRSSKGDVLTVGYPYVSTANTGRLTDPDYLPKRSAHYETIIVASYTNANYYHFIIETLAKVAAVLHHLEQTGQNTSLVKILVDESDVCSQYFETLGLSHMVLHHVESILYTADNVYVADYHWKQTEELSFHHSELFFVPTSGMTRSVVDWVAQHTIDAEVKKPFRVVFAHRSASKMRSIRNQEELDATLEVVVSKYEGIEYTVSGIDTMAQQRQLYSEAVVVIGPHGAGLTNVAFCQEGASLIELTVIPHKASVYSQVCRSLNVDYWTVPSAEATHWGKFQLDQQALADIADTVDHILKNRA